MAYALTKTEAIARAKKWLEKQGTGPEAWEEVTAHVHADLRRLPPELHYLPPNGGGTGGWVVVVGDDDDMGVAIAIHCYRGDNKNFGWDARGE